MIMALCRSLETMKLSGMRCGGGVHWEGSECDPRGPPEAAVAIRRKSRREVTWRGTLLVHRVPLLFFLQHRQYSRGGGSRPIIFVRDPFLLLKWKKMGPITDQKEERRERALSQAEKVEEGDEEEEEATPLVRQERRVDTPRKRRQFNLGSTPLLKKQGTWFRYVYMSSKF